MAVKSILKAVVALFVVAVVLSFVFGPAYLEKSQNVVVSHEPYQISAAAQALHKTLIVGDWHADSMLWARDIAERNSYGHVDIPRMQEGNQAIQMFTTVTKAPAGLNYSENDAATRDQITAAAILQRWPMATWGSLTARAVFQAEKLQAIAADDANKFQIILTQTDLENFLQQRVSDPELTAGLIGTEGSHALDGSLDNIQLLFDHGFRMMSLQHFFDNKLGGSLHGVSHAGLTEFGHDAVQKMLQLGIIIDVSHSSEQVVRDTLKISTTPLVVSHTGLKGFCDSPRNIPDELMQKIAAKGGLIAVGYWEGAICGMEPRHIAKAIKYGIDLLGAEHVSLGSDYDGSVTTLLDSSELAAITQALMDINVPDSEIRKVMGGNMVRFLGQYLPN
jgi:microsomal dipeptidase-like Zn-dependent dipeptidase